jgi:hypothetical protein
MTRITMRIRTWWSPILVAAVVSAWSRDSKAQLTITSAGGAQGLSLTTFAAGFPTSSGVGPIGIAFSGGGVLVTDFPGHVRLFPSHADGQNAASVPSPRITDQLMLTV